MKIGILTFHSAHNYGAVLQAYALQEFLVKLGHDSYLIDYRPNYIQKNYIRDNCRDWVSKNPIMCARRLWNYLRYRKIRHQRWDGFEDFINKRFNLYPFCDGDNFAFFDAVVIGSDQVWSALHTGGKFDEIMFGANFMCKTISYAPSCSQTLFNKQQISFLKTHLSHFFAISVRESSFKKALQPLTNKKIHVVLDPTLLVGREPFDLISTTISRKRPFVLIYEIKQHKGVRLMAKRIANHFGADVVELTNGMLNYHMNSMDEGASPEKFVGYFKNACYVITSSFHGTAFSLLYERPFYVVKQNNNADGRMVSLLSALDLEDRLIDVSEELHLEDVSYSCVKERIGLLRRTSEDFLIKHLEQ